MRATFLELAIYIYLSWSKSLCVYCWFIALYLYSSGCYRQIRSCDVYKTIFFEKEELIDYKGVFEYMISGIGTLWIAIRIIALLQLPWLVHLWISFSFWFCLMIFLLLLLFINNKGMLLFIEKHSFGSTDSLWENSVASVLNNHIVILITW